MAGGRVPPDTSHQKISADLPGKERQGKMENWEEKKEMKEKMKMEGGKVRKWGEALFSGSTKMGIFYREKVFHDGKKIREKDFVPSEKYPFYVSVNNHRFQTHIVVSIFLSEIYFQIVSKYIWLFANE